jgi:hypothetical protein
MHARRLALVAVVLVAGCGGEDEGPRSKPRAQAPAVTPFPSIDFTGLEPGREYTTRRFTPRIRITLPPGEWKAESADKPDHVEIQADPVGDVTAAGLGFHHMTKVFDPAEGGEIPGDAVDGPDDFAAWLTAHPHLRTTDPEPVKALGLEGVSIDVRVRSSQPRLYRDCGKVTTGDCVVMYVGGIEPYVYGSDTYGRFLILEQPDGKELVVEQFVEPASAFRRQVKLLDAALASASIVP